MKCNTQMLRSYRGSSECSHLSQCFYFVCPVMIPFFSVMLLKAESAVIRECFLSLLDLLSVNLNDQTSLSLLACNRSISAFFQIFT